jgi:hypothetical protein
MFEQQRALERGDESYGTTIYSTSTLGREDRIMEDAAEENGAKSINDLIKVSFFKKKLFENLRFF